MTDFDAIVRAIEKLPRRNDVDVREQAGRIWFAWRMGAGNEELKRQIAEAKKQLGWKRKPVTNAVALDALNHAEGDRARAIEVLKEWELVIGTQRGKELRARWVVFQAVGVYHALAGRPAPRSRNGENAGEAIGPLVPLCEDLFAAVGIDPKKAERHVQTWMQGE
jgi:hypothetical protein